jgi:N utilization substance protein B
VREILAAWVPPGLFRVASCRFYLAFPLYDDENHEATPTVFSVSFRRRGRRHLFPRMPFDEKSFIPDYSMNRRKAREYVLQILFQAEFAGTGCKVLPPDDFWSDKDGKGRDDLKGFANELARGTMENIGEIDRVIQKAAEHWDVRRMAAVDRNILRFAVYEILYRKDIPSAVTMNEALEIAKKYSSLESVPFINGLLDKIARDAGKK